MAEEELPPPDLSLVTNEQLVTELVNRHDHIVIVRETKRNDGFYEALYDLHGGISAALGLCERAKLRLLRLSEKAADAGEAAKGDEDNG